MLRKTIIVITLLPATYFWVITLILGITQPFFASLVVGGLLGIIGLIRVGWGLGSQVSSGKLVTQLFLCAGILSALTGIIFLFSEISKTRGYPIVGLLAIMALFPVTIVGAFELYRISRIASEDNGN